MTPQQELNKEHAETRLAYHHTMDMMKELVNSLQTDTPKYQRLHARLDRLCKIGRVLDALIKFSHD